MYIVNGIDLQSSEYEELGLLVIAERDNGDAKQVAEKHLNPTGEKHDFDQKYVEVYEGLLEAGLIKGIKLYGGFLFRGITQKGFDFIDDYNSVTSHNENEKKKQRLHDYKIAAFGVVGGFLSGAFGSWVVDMIYSFISTL